MDALQEYKEQPWALSSHHVALHSEHDLTFDEELQTFCISEIPPTKTREPDPK